MQLKSKLTALVAVSAVITCLVAGSFSFDTYTRLQLIERNALAGGEITPIRALGEALYRHKSLLLVNASTGGGDPAGIARSKASIESAMAELRKSHQRLLNDFRSVLQISNLSTAVDQVLALQANAGLSVTAVLDVHEAAFAQFIELVEASSDAFKVLADPNVDFVLLMMTQFDVLPSLLRGRAQLIGRLFLLDEISSGRAQDGPTSQEQIADIRRSKGIVSALLERALNYTERAASLDKHGRGWDQVAPGTMALAFTNDRFSERVEWAIRTPPAAINLVAEDAAFLDGLLEVWSLITKIVDERLKDRLAEDRAQAMTVVGLTGFATLVFGIATVLGVRRVASDLAVAEAAAASIAGGILECSVPKTDRWDEIGGLMRAIDILRESSIAWRALQAKEREVYDHLSSTATRVAEAVEAIRTAASEMSQGSNDLAFRTERQAFALQSAAQKMAAVAATGVSNADNSDRARTLTADALTRAQSGDGAVADVMSAMARIESSSARIGTIIQVMEEISFHTKLLAVNAAVEAARAGGAGKGFAVVAQEIRSLADRSRLASQQIRDLIEEGLREIERGVPLARVAGGALKDIIQSVRLAADLVPVIADSSRQQARSVADMNIALADLDAATQQNAALVEQSSSSAAALADQATQLAQAVIAFRK